MADYVLFVLTAPFDGQEQAYNQWYTDQHLSDVVAIPGVQSAQRFTPVTPQGEPRYLALYEIADPHEALVGLRARSGTPLMSMTPALDASRTQTMMLTEIESGRVEGIDSVPMQAGDLVAVAYDPDTSAGGAYRIFTPHEAQLRPSQMPPRVVIVSGLELAGSKAATGVGARVVAYRSTTAQIPKPAVAAAQA